MKCLSIPIITWLFIFSLGSFSTHGQQFKWATGGGTMEGLSSSPSDYWERTEYMCTDENGNIYALSQVGTDPIHADTFYAAGAYGDDLNTLLTSYDCNGQMRWAKLIASSGGECRPEGIAVDSLGHVYVAGFFENLGGGSGLHIGYDTILSGWTYQSQALIQFDTSGNYNWFRFVGADAESTDAGTGYVGAILTMDGSNNAHFLNYMKSGVEITPTLTSICGTYDLVYNGSGTLLSSVRINLDSEWYFNGAVIDPVTNKLYVSGTINQYIYGGFRTDTFYAAAFDASRNLLWQYFCGHGDDDDVAGVVLDQNKNLYFSGGAAPAVFSFHGDSVTGTCGSMAVVMSTDTNGNVKWIKNYGDCPTSINGFIPIALLPNEQVVVGGGFEGAVSGSGISLSTPPGEGESPYFVVLDSGGNLLTVQQVHGDGSDNAAFAISTDKVGNIYVGGYVADSIWAGSPSVGYQSIGGNTDFFIMKYGVDCSCTSSPIASFTDTGTHTIGVTYTGTTTGLDSMVWNFGDGSPTVTGTPALHTYSVAGTYNVCVIVYTTCGSDIHCSDVIIPCWLFPVASFTKAGTSPVNTTYTGTTSTVDSIVWHFGDGSRATGTTATHTYSSIGIYNICVIAYSPCGIDSVCQYDTVLCLSSPVASFADTGIITIGATYTGTSTAVDSTVWNFGDGSSTVTGASAIHTYSAIGAYHVCVTAYSPCGSNTSCKYDTVLCIVPPVASFTDTGTHRVGFTYTGTTADIDSVVWSFGDGHTSTGVTPIHTYTASGTYHVCVTTYTGCGIDSVCKDITVIVPSGISIISPQGNIKVFPNPANDELSITGLTGNMNYRLLSVTGTCVLQGSLPRSGGNISIQQIVSGVYILELVGEYGERNILRVVKD